MAALVVVITCVGCSLAEESDPAPSRVVIAVTATANEPQPKLSARATEIVESAIDSNRGALQVLIGDEGGARTLYEASLIPMRGDRVENDPGRREDFEEEAIAEIDMKLVGASGDSGQLDVVGLLHHIGRIPGPATVYLQSSALQSTGPLAIDRVGWDAVGTDALIDRAEAAELVPDLEDKIVVFGGVGDVVVGPQEEVPPQLRRRLMDFLIKLCERGGALSCIRDDEPGRGGDPRSTVPVPTVDVSELPPLDEPTEQTEPSDDPIRLPADLLFAPHSAALLPEAVGVLADVVASLPPTAQLTLQGRTASVGTAESSAVLSLARADAVADSMINDHHFPAEQITTVGLGHDDPVVNDRDAQGRLLPGPAAQNRSVTVLITSIGDPHEH